MRAPHPCSSAHPLPAHLRRLVVDDTRATKMAARSLAPQLTHRQSLERLKASVPRTASRWSA